MTTFALGPYSPRPAPYGPLGSLQRAMLYDSTGTPVIGLPLTETVIAGDSTFPGSVALTTPPADSLTAWRYEVRQVTAQSDAAFNASSVVTVPNSVYGYPVGGIWYESAAELAVLMQANALVARAAPLSSAATQAATAAALLANGLTAGWSADVDAQATSAATNAMTAASGATSLLTRPSPLSAQQTADAAKLAPTAGTPAAGSVMDRLVAVNTNNPGPGPGPYAITITVTDGTAPLQGARVTYTQAGVIRGTKATDASGVAALSLPAGTYTRNVYLTGYNGSTVAHNFAGDASAAVTLAPLVVAPPADPGQTTAYGITRTAKGAAAPGVTVYFELLDPSGVSIWQRSASAVSDGAGLLQVPLAKSSKYRASLDKRLWTTFTTGATDTFALPEILQGVDR